MRKMSTPPVVFSNMAVELTSSPITPEWIIDGKPEARNALLSRSDDYTCSTILWDCTEGRFNWYYGIDETVHILEGSVTVDDGHSPPRKLLPGDTAFFPKGSHAVWHVEKYVKKVAFCRIVLPEPVGSLLKLARAVKNRLSPPKAAGSLLGAG
jgi:uncharacterized cupin superfamily protein